MWSELGSIAYLSRVRRGFMKLLALLLLLPMMGCRQCHCDLEGQDRIDKLQNEALNSHNKSIASINKTETSIFKILETLIGKPK